MVARLPMPLNHLAHDFALTPTKAVIIASPFVLPTVPLGLLSKRSLLSLLKWKPGLGTRLLVVDRISGAVRHYRAEGFLLHHTLNAFDDGHDIVVDLCAYPDASVFDLFREPLAGRWPKVRNAAPELFRLAADGGGSRRTLRDGRSSLANFCSAITRGPRFSIAAEKLLSTRLGVIGHIRNMINPAIGSLVAFDVAGATWSRRASAYHSGYRPRTGCAALHSSAVRPAH